MDTSGNTGNYAGKRCQMLEWVFNRCCGILVPGGIQNLTEQPALVGAALNEKLDYMSSRDHSNLSIISVSKHSA